MLLRKNRALGIKSEPEAIKVATEKSKISPTSETSQTRKVSARLENLCKPRTRIAEVTRTRSFSEESKPFRGRTSIKAEP